MKDSRTYADRAQYLRKAVVLRRKRLRRHAREYMGSQCMICGYNRCQEALEFHHRDPSQKDFGISSRGYTYSWKRIKNEIRKCVLLCSNCHREVHCKMTQLPEETLE